MVLWILWKALPLGYEAAQHVVGVDRAAPLGHAADVQLPGQGARIGMSNLLEYPE